MNSSALSSNPALNAAQLEEKLDEFLEPILSPRRTATRISADLAVLTHLEQDFVLHWVSVVSKTSAELAFQFASYARRALSTLGEQGTQAWIIYAMDVYDRNGLYQANCVLKDRHVFESEKQHKAEGISFEEVSGILDLFLRGLSGRRLKLEPGEEVYTDTTGIFLPFRIASFATRAQNFKLYKATAAYLWAQTRFGTFDQDILAEIERHPCPERAQRWLEFCEAVRIHACISRSLPGLARDLLSLRDSTPAQKILDTCAPLEVEGATVADSLALVLQLYFEPLPTPWLFCGKLLPERAANAKRVRITKDKLAFQSALHNLAEDAEMSEPIPARSVPMLSLHKTAKSKPDQLPYHLEIGGRPINPPQFLIELMQSIVQDFGEIPSEYLVTAGDGTYYPEASTEHKPADVWKGFHHEEGVFIYNEWDFRRQHYRKNWCVLRELDLHPGNTEFVTQTLQKYSGQVLQLKRLFEALREDNQLLRKQKHGDDIDFDAVVAAYADLRCGSELTERLYSWAHKNERDLAVMFMVDMSGSTKGLINDAEREALVVLCEALEKLDDRYAIYGFSGITRKRCELYRIKRFDETYSELVKQRIAGIIPRDYTRMGVTIRHLTTLLNAIEARTKLLITLSDGKPDDYSDGYHGVYGIEDTRQALIEAQHCGIHRFCITIDTEARDYLPHMYGEANYIVIDDVSRLPLKIGDIYRRLTA